MEYLDNILAQLNSFELPESDSLITPELLEAEEKLQEDVDLLIKALETMKTQLEEIQEFAEEAQEYIDQMTEIGNTVYEELTASEEILSIRQKWFYPEVRESEAGQWIWYVIQTLLAVVVFFIMYNVYYRYKERKTKKEYLRQTTQLELLLKLQLTM